MENATEVLETACAAIILAIAFATTVFLSNTSKKGDIIMAENISYEWLITADKGGIENE